MFAIPRARFSTRLPIVLLAAALTIGLAAIEVVPASAGPTASVAKKKCSKKKRKKGKCGKSSGDPVAALTALFAGSSFSGPSADRDTQYTDEWKFCRDGTYQRHYESTGTTGFDPPVPFHTATTYGGTWKFEPGALQRKTGELKGYVDTTITSWQDSEGHPPFAAADSDTVVVPPGEPFIVIGDHPVWHRTPGGAGC
jgi:hypothetical protein